VISHFKDLPSRQVVHLIPSHVQSMICGAEKLTQNRKGEITIHYSGGQVERVQMSDLNLAVCDDFMAAFKTVWQRKETGA